MELGNTAKAAPKKSNRSSEKFNGISRGLFGGRVFLFDRLFNLAMLTPLWK